MKSFLTILHTILVFCMIVTLFALPAAAESVTTAASYVFASYSEYTADVFAPAADSGTGVRRLNMNAPWNFRGDIMNVRQHIRNGSYTVDAKLGTDECEGKTIFTLEMADDLSQFRTLYFGIGFKSSMKTSFPIKVELELSDHEGNRMISQVYLQMPEEGTASAGWWNLLCFDLSIFEERDDTALLKITVSYHPSDPPSILWFTNPYVRTAEDDGFAYAERYLTNELKESAGTFSMKSGAACPDERGRLQLHGNFVITEQPEIGTDAFLEIKLSRVQSGGLTVKLQYDNGEIAYAGRISLETDGVQDSATYTLPIDVFGQMRNFELTFDNVVCETYFKVESIRLHYDNHRELEGNSDLGKVTSLTHVGNSVVFTGEMQRNAVREYDGSVLRFYAIPGWTSSDLSTAVEIGQMKLSTRFEYTADLSAYPYLADTCRFFAGLKTDDGNIRPLSQPIYTNAAELTETSLSNVGLYDAAAVGVFESNVSHVIVDVLLNRLLSDPTTGDRDSSSLSYTVYQTVQEDPDAERKIFAQTATTPVNHTYLSELDNEINFYISAGLEVYLRIASETVLSGLTYEEPGAEQYAVSPESAEARQFYAAIVRYLCRRYPGIGGLVTGSAVNLGQWTGGGIDAQNAASYAHNLAELCRITYNAAFSEIADIRIVLPFAPEDFRVSGNNAFCTLDTKSLTVMMVSYLSEMGTVPWIMMYCAEDMTDILGVDILSGDGLADGMTYSDKDSAAQRTRQLTDELALESSAAIMYYYEPDYAPTLEGFEHSPEMTVYSEYLAELFAKLCGSTRARAVFLSLDRLNVHLEHEFFAYLKKTESIPESGHGETSGRRVVMDFAAIPSADVQHILDLTVSQKYVWDFSDSFYPLGWIAGGGVSSCLTVYSDLFSDPEASRYSRVLRSAISLDEDSVSHRNSGMAAGISLRNLTRTVDMREVDYLEFTFALNHPGLVMGTGHESGTVVFLIGSDDQRAEFKVESAVPEQVLTYVCDLSDYEFRDRVDFLGIMVYADHDVYLDLQSVRAYSNTLFPDEMDAVFSPNPVVPELAVDYETVAVVSVIVFVLSIGAVVLLIRHDAEERRERQKRLIADRHIRYERTRR